jgi:hypothetical protein
MLRTVAGSVAGYFATALLSAATQYAIGRLTPSVQSGDANVIPAGFLAAELAYRFVFGVAGGWLAAAIARQRLGSTGMAVLSFLLGLAATLAFGSAHWYHIAIPILGVTAAVFGGYVWARNSHPEPLV